MTSSLVGSEMCIRDRKKDSFLFPYTHVLKGVLPSSGLLFCPWSISCLLYTSELPTICSV
eukprot:8247018-Prorocentrum_lima.AAC.1